MAEIEAKEGKPFTEKQHKAILGGAFNHHLSNLKKRYDVSSLSSDEHTQPQIEIEIERNIRACPTCGIDRQDVFNRIVKLAQRLDDILRVRTDK